MTKRGKSEAERPFWISYADLMTAMMMLCLVAMAVTILAISQEVHKEKSDAVKREEEIQALCERVRSGVGDGSGVGVNCQNFRIDFGVAGRFDFNKYVPNSDLPAKLSALVPAVLDAAAQPEGKKWLKQVVIEGYTDTTGSYLSNLFLSLQRSYWVMCEMVDPNRNLKLGFSADQIQQVKELFLAGGVSFNDAKESSAESRRIELRLQFYTLDEYKNGANSARPKIVSTQPEVCKLS